MNIASTDGYTPLKVHIGKIDIISLVHFHFQPVIAVNFKSVAYFISSPMMGTNIAILMIPDNLSHTLP
jgi:hypothetical protein